MILCALTAVETRRPLLAIGRRVLPPAIPPGCRMDPKPWRERPRGSRASASSRFLKGSLTPRFACLLSASSRRCRALCTRRTDAHAERDPDGLLRATFEASRGTCRRAITRAIVAPCSAPSMLSASLRPACRQVAGLRALTAPARGVAFSNYVMAGSTRAAMFQMDEFDGDFKWRYPANISLVPHSAPPPRRPTWSADRTTPQGLGRQHP